MKERTNLIRIVHKPGLLLFLLLFILVSSACSTVLKTGNIVSGTAVEPSPEKIFYTFRIVDVYPHQADAFTQGLVFQDDILYEGTGLQGKSSLRKVELETGRVLHRYDLPDAYFGEGITIFQDIIIQLTWKSGKGFIYNKNDFNLLGEFTYPTEGWGITHNGKTLFMSDGTSTIYFLDPLNLQAIGSIEVHDDGVPVDRLNELEYINGRIYSNIWQTDSIAIINPEDGAVTGWIDLAGLLQSQDYSGPADVLNGIAYDAQGDRLFVTGKLWPYLFEIEIMAGAG
ncbi:MAG: glutaminyl-peptide cyclotransferase [Dehalococcoidales bacterium]|nr:glutaminyl-peptide cyclotransferase [Dehalococcoidales bacterium]